MTIQDAIAQAEAILPGRAAAQGEMDSRWQAVIAVAEFIESEPDEVWSFALRWGRSDDEDLRMAIATCVLEHLLERHFDPFISRVEEAVCTDSRFAGTVSCCWRFGQSEEPSRAARWDRLIASLQRQTG